MKLSIAIKIASAADLHVLRRKFITYTDKTVCNMYKTYRKAYETLAEQPQDVFMEYCTDGLMDCLLFLEGYLAWRYCNYVKGGKA